MLCIYILFCTLLVWILVLWMLRFRNNWKNEHFQDVGENDTDVIDEETDEASADTDLTMGVETPDGDLAILTDAAEYPDPKILMEIEDIEESDLVQEPGNIDLAEYVPSFEMSATENQVGNEARIYFVPRDQVQNCDRGMYRRPLSWFRRYSNRFQGDGADIRQNVVRTNCRYALSAWRTIVPVTQNEYLITSEEAKATARSNPMDWLKVVQEVPRGQEPVGKTNALLHNVSLESQTPTHDTYSAFVKTIAGPEVSQLVCRNSDWQSMNTWTLPQGTYFVFDGIPLRKNTLKIMVNGRPAELSRSTAGTFASFFKDELKREGSSERFSKVGAYTTVQAQIYMRDFCGNIRLYDTVSVGFQFTKKIVLKVANVSDTVTTGTPTQLAQRISEFERKIRDLTNAKYRIWWQLEERHKWPLNNMRQSEWNSTQIANWNYMKQQIRAFITQEHRRYSSMNDRRRYFRSWSTLTQYYDCVAYIDKFITTRRVKKWVRGRQVRVTEQDAGLKDDRCYTCWDIIRNHFNNTVYYTNIAVYDQNIQTYNDHIRRIRDAINQMNLLFPDGIANLIREGSYNLWVASPNSLYQRLDDLFSAESLNSNGEPLEGTERLYIKMV